MSEQVSSLDVSQDGEDYVVRYGGDVYRLLKSKGGYFFYHESTLRQVRVLLATLEEGIIFCKGFRFGYYKGYDRADANRRAEQRYVIKLTSTVTGIMWWTSKGLVKEATQAQKIIKKSEVEKLRQTIQASYPTYFVQWKIYKEE